MGEIWHVNNFWSINAKVMKFWHNLVLDKAQLNTKFQRNWTTGSEFNRPPKSTDLCFIYISAGPGRGGVCAAVVRALLGRLIVSPDWVWPRGACQRCDLCLVVDQRSHNKIVLLLFMFPTFSKQIHRLAWMDRKKLATLLLKSSSGLTG